MKKITKIGVWLLCVLFTWPAVSQTYDEQELADLRAFLRQPSAEEGKINAEQFNYFVMGQGSKPIDTNALISPTEWIQWIGKVGNFEEIDGVNRLVELPYQMKKIAGHLYMPNCTYLKKVNLYRTNVSSIDVSKNENLEVLTLSESAVSKVDVSNNPKLTSLAIISTGITEIDVTQNKQLLSLTVDKTNITEIDLFSNALLTALSCIDCRRLKELDLSNTLSLTTLILTNCTELKKLDVSGLGNLSTLSCNGSAIEILDLQSNVKLKLLQLKNMALKKLYLPQAEELTSIYLDDSKLTEIQGLSGLSRLEALSVINNHLTSLDVSQNTNLINIYCQGNELTEIKGLGNLTNLMRLHCQDNKLTDLSELPLAKITELHMQNNRLRLSGMPARTKTEGAIGFYTFFPQDTLKIAVLPGNEIDLSSEYQKTAASQTENTEFLWFDITDGTEKPIELSSETNGIFKTDAGLTGKTLRCKMTNPLFTFNNNQQADAFPIVLDVTIPGTETFASAEVEAIKTFLRQNSAVEGKTNADLLEIDTTSWNHSSLWLYTTDGITLAVSGTTRHIAGIEWPGRKLAGNAGFDGFAHLQTLDISGNQITELSLNECPKLETLKCNDNALRFSTLPAISLPNGTFEIAPQATLAGGRIDFEQGIDLSAEAKVTIGGVETATEYKWFDITDGEEVAQTGITGEGGVFTLPEETAGKTLRCKMTNTAYWGTAEAAKLTLLYEVTLNKERVYAGHEVAQLKDFLRQSSATLAKDGACNFEKLGLTAADTARWNTSTSWLAYIDGVSYTVSNDTNYIAGIDWLNKELAGDLILTGVEKMTILNVSGNDLTKVDVSGGKMLSELQMLNNSRCEELDLTGCGSLTKLYAQNCALNTLDISSCNLIEHVQVFNNRLATFDASGKTNLKNLYLHDNRLTSVTLTACTALERLNVSGNELEQLDVTASPLTFLECGKNRLSFATLPKKAIASYSFSPQADFPIDTLLSYTEGIDLSTQNSVVFPEKETARTVFEWLDITSGTAQRLDSLAVTDNGSGKFAIAKTASGRDLQCFMTNANFPGLTLTYTAIIEEPVDWYKAEELNELRTFLRLESQTEGIANAFKLGLSHHDTLHWNTSGKWIVRLNSQGHTAWATENEGKADEIKRLSGLSISSTGVAGMLALPSCTKLQGVSCVANGLTGIDISNSTELGELWCYRNYIPELDVSKLTKLSSLYCDQNLLTKLELKNHPQMRHLRCGWNKLSLLDISGCPTLFTLQCQDNALTELDVTQNTKLTDIICSKNRLTELDLSRNPELSEFQASYNFFTFFDFATYNKKMWHLYLDNNRLEGIVLSDLTIESVNIAYNKLTYATIPFDFRRKDYLFAPQDTIDLGTIGNGEVLDISDQYMLDTDGSHTFYQWEVLSGSQFVATNDVTTVDETGKFVFNENAIGKRFRCTLTNNNVYRQALTLEFFVNVVRGTGNQEENPVEISVRPNPTNGIVTISSDREIGRILLYDSHGRLMLETEKIASTVKTIDLSDYPTGLYFLKAGDRILKVIRK